MVLSRTATALSDLGNERFRSQLSVSGAMVTYEARSAAIAVIHIGFRFKVLPSHTKKGHEHRHTLCRLNEAERRLCFVQGVPVMAHPRPEGARVLPILVTGAKVIVEHAVVAGQTGFPRQIRLRARRSIVLIQHQLQGILFLRPARGRDGNTVRTVQRLIVIADTELAPGKRPAPII